MLFSLLYGLHTEFSAFNVFRYVTFRTILAILTALVLSFLITPFLIRTFKEWKIRVEKREDLPERHNEKKGTPTMGGVGILICTIVATILWADLRNYYVWILILTLFLFGLIGLLDDMTKLRDPRAKGIPGRWKFLLQTSSAMLVSLLLYWKSGFITRLSLPFFKNVAPDLGYFYLLLCIFMIVGASNSVNLTDGLDGLAIGPVLTVTSIFMLFCYLAGHAKFASYLQIFHVRGASELTIVCGAISGAGTGFLWYNAHPAELFMGDTGSLPLGAALATVALIIKQEVMLALAGGIFVLEALSVIVQVLSFKLTGKRVFKMAPLHHHFELKGWNEGKIVVRFWIVSIILALIAISTLKLR